MQKNDENLLTINIETIYQFLDNNTNRNINVS